MEYTFVTTSSLEALSLPIDNFFSSSSIHPYIVNWNTLNYSFKAMSSLGLLVLSIFKFAHALKASNLNWSPYMCSCAVPKKIITKKWEGRILPEFVTGHHIIKQGCVQLLIPLTKKCSLC